MRPWRIASRAGFFHTSLRSISMISSSTPSTPTSYRDHWRKLVDLEWEAEQALARDRRHKWSEERLTREGVWLTNLRVRRQAASGSNVILALLTADGAKLPTHDFGELDAVILAKNEAKDAPADTVDSSAESSAGDKDLHAQVRRVSQHVIQLVLQRTADFDKSWTDETWSIYKVANQAAHQRTCDALDKVVSASSTSPIGQMRALLLAQSAGDAEMATSVMPTLKGAVEHVNDDTMNHSQLEALSAALSAPLSLIQGPPGTGKTATACELLVAIGEFQKQTAADGQRRPLLACAHSNVAVDQLAEGLVKRDARVVRVGSSANASEAVQKVNLTHLVATHARAPEVKALADGLRALFRDIMKLQQRIREFQKLREQTGDDAAIEQPRWDTYKMDFAQYKNASERFKQERVELETLEKDLLNDIVTSSDIVCSTMVGAANAVLAPVSFSMVLIDEATQATEPMSWIALAKVEGPVVLVGDQKQLPPTCLNNVASNAGLSTSLFDRLISSGWPCLSMNMLTEQYRMHPLIRSFPSNTFYDRKLTDAPAAQGRRPPAALKSAVTFVDVSDGREERARETSWLNRAEVDVVLDVVRTICNAGDVAERDIGILSPYAAQIAALRSASSAIMPELSIKSVDGFQGSEKDVIILTCVRANMQRRIGFLSDARRLNVAITRARRGLVVIGNRNTLLGDPLWAAFLKFIHEQGWSSAPSEWIRSSLASLQRPEAKEEIETLSCSGCGSTVAPLSAVRFVMDRRVGCALVADMSNVGDCKRSEHPDSANNPQKLGKIHCNECGQNWGNIQTAPMRPWKKQPLAFLKMSLMRVGSEKAAISINSKALRREAEAQRSKSDFSTIYTVHVHKQHDDSTCCVRVQRDYGAGTRG